MKKLFLKLAIIALILVAIISFAGDQLSPIFAKYGDPHVVQSQLTTYLLIFAAGCAFLFILKTLIGFIILGVILLLIFYLFQSGVFEFISF